MIDRKSVMDLRAEIKKIAREEVKKAIEEQIEPKREEPSYEAVKEYCRKRCLSIVDTALLGKYMQPVQQWIPCGERLPEEDTEVLISYRYKEGEGNTDHVNIDITSYGTVCFGGREIHTLKEWRQPFDYFHANYEVIAWMPLPEPYKGDANG